MEALKLRYAREMWAARRSGLIGPIAAVGIPVAAFSVMLVTVTICLCIWRGSPSYLPGVLFPAISELSVDLPQRRIYQVGFFICGALISMAVLLYDELAVPTLLASSTNVEGGPPPSCRSGSIVRIVGLATVPELNGSTGVCQSMIAGRWNVCLQNGIQKGKVKTIKADNLVQVSKEDGLNLQSMLLWGHLTALGVALQGVFPLARSISLQCFIHWGGAILFMASAMQHGKASLEFYDRAAKRGTALLKNRTVNGAMRVRRFILTYSSAALFMVLLLMQVFPLMYGAGAHDGSDQSHTATTPAPPQPSVVGESSDNDNNRRMAFDARSMNTMGLMQWGIILQFAIFFCTYATDMGAAVVAEKKTMTAS